MFLLVFWSVCCFWRDLSVWSMMNMIALGTGSCIIRKVYYSSIAAIPDRYTDSSTPYSVQSLTLTICPRYTCLSQPVRQPISAPVIPMRKALVRPTESADAAPPTSSSPFDFQTVGIPSTKTLPPPVPHHQTTYSLSSLNHLQLSSIARL